MRALAIVLLSALVLTAPGCMYCENGLCSPDEKEAIFDPDLVGDWDGPQDKKSAHEDEGFYRIERDDPASKAYRITVYKNGKPDRDGPLKAYLVRLGDFLFLDLLIPREEKRLNPKPSVGHFLFKVDLKKPAGNGVLTKPEATLRILRDQFVEAHPEAIACALQLGLPKWKLRTFDLRLMFDARDASGLPAEGRSLIAVAAGGPMPFVRIFDEAGKIAMNLDLARLKGQTEEIEDFEKRLDPLRPPHEVTAAEKAQIVAAIDAINTNARPPKILATSQELRDFVLKHARDAEAWKGSKDQEDFVLRRR